MAQRNPEPDLDLADSFSAVTPVALADEKSAVTGSAPPHLLWETLETAYAPPPERVADPDEPRLAAYIALPIIIGVSLTLWVGIVELVLMR